MLKELTLAVSIGVDVQAWLCMLALGQEQSSGLPAYLPFPSTLLPSVLLPPPHLWDIYVNEPTPAHCAHVSLYCLYLFRLMPWRFFFSFPSSAQSFPASFSSLGSWYVCVPLPRCLFPCTLNCVPPSNSVSVVRGGTATFCFDACVCCMPLGRERAAQRRAGTLCLVL